MTADKTDSVHPFAPNPAGPMVCRRCGEWFDAECHRTSKGGESMFHNCDCGSVGGGWPHPASAHNDEDADGR